jgi:hypothetical protein
MKSGHVAVTESTLICGVLDSTSALHPICIGTNWERDLRPVVSERGGGGGAIGGRKPKIPIFKVYI